MSDDPYLNNVPTMTGGFGRDGVRAFYRDHLVGKFFPPDVSEKRSLLLERIAVKLDLHGPAFTDSDIDTAIALAMVGLVREPA